MAEPLAALLALALAVAPVPSVSPTASSDAAARTRTATLVEVDAPTETEPEPEAIEPVAADPEPAPTSPAIEGPAPAPTPAAVGGLCHGSRPCKRLVVLASVTGGLGLAGMIAGGILVARPQRVDPDDPTQAIAYRPVGSAALAIGLGVLATSLLMTLAAARAIRHARKGGLTASRRPLALRLSAG